MNEDKRGLVRATTLSMAHYVVRASALCIEGHEAHFYQRLSEIFSL